MDAIPSKVMWIISEHVIVLQLDVFYEPFGTLSVAIVPCAETSSLLWPQVDHLSSLIQWV